MSIHAIKAVGIGLGAEVAAGPAPRCTTKSFARPDARDGTMPVVRGRPIAPAASKAASPTAKSSASPAWMKPISTLMKPLRSVDLTTIDEAPAAIERSDVCAVPAAAVVGEAMVCLVLADAVLERFGGDSMRQLERAPARDAPDAVERPA